MYIHSTDVEVTVTLVCATSRKVQNMQMSIVDPVAPEAIYSQHRVMLRKLNIHYSHQPRTCTVMGGHLNPGFFAEYAGSIGLNVPLNTYS
jgi:hypothetical protein